MEESTGDTSSTLNAVTTQTLNTPSRIKDSKKGKSKVKPLYFWTSADVSKWLKKHAGYCYGLYSDLLVQNDVTGRTLILLNEMKLERMGVTQPKHRHDLLQHILRLRLKHDLSSIKSFDQKSSGFELKLPDPKT